MSQSNPAETPVPVLTEVVRTAIAAHDGDLDGLLAEVQTRLAARTFKLTEELLLAALAEMQATLYEQVSAKLRARLPELIDATLREHFEPRAGV
jgi:hypothetical protein